MSPSIFICASGAPVIHVFSSLFHCLPLSAEAATPIAFIINMADLKAAHCSRLQIQLTVNDAAGKTRNKSCHSRLSDKGCPAEPRRTKTSAPDFSGPIKHSKCFVFFLGFQRFARNLFVLVWARSHFSRNIVRSRICMVPGRPGTPFFLLPIDTSKRAR